MVLKSLRRLFSGSPRPVDPGVLRQWAEERGHVWRRVRDADGCVIEGHQGGHPWRIEWGAPTREYIPGLELRLLSDLDLPKELQAMVLNRQLMQVMEKAVYDHFVDDVQTRIETDTPPEMRWLVLYPKVGPADLGRLRERYGAVCSIAPWMLQWLRSPLNDALAATIEMADAADPVVLTIGRGRLTLRTTMPQPEPRRIAMWASVFEHALREARRLGTEWRDVAGSHSTQPSTWSHSALHGGSTPDVPL